ncbi:ABC transporter substrate-binding protein [Natronorarus salvus]|uniref:ABC transporter substrate-binding protein n=1 Tax=Natronorarus salvus TaxID=3117733 RepID=UPI002F26569B
MAPERRGRAVGRRTYLRFAGAATASAMLAGCLDGEDPDDPDDVADDDADPDTDDADTDDDDDPDTEDDDASVTITQGQFASTLDPQDHRETPTDNVILQAYEGLLDREPDGTIREGLATDWEYIDEQEGQVRFEFREDVTFHNGDEMTMDDVAFSILRVVDPDVGIVSPQADQLAGVVDAEPDGENAVVVTSDGVNPMVFGNFASYCQVMQESWVEEAGDEVGQDINGTGPYRLEEFTEDEFARFVVYDDYWGDEVEVEEVVYDAASESSTRVNSLLAGESDVVESVPPQDAPRVEDEDGTRIEAVPSTRVLFMPMRNNVEPFDSLEFRQAMNYAIDLETIIDEILAGFGDPTGQPTLEGYVGYNEEIEPYPYDPDTAEELVEESGYSDAEIELHAPAGRYLGDIEIAQAVSGYIDDLPNVSCELEQREFGSLADEILDGDLDTSPEFFMIGWGNTTFDASQTIIPWFGEGTATQAFVDEEVYGLIDEAQNEADEETREETLRETNEYLNEQAPWVFLNRQYSVYGISDRLDWEARQDEHILAKEMGLQ